MAGDDDWMKGLRGFMKRQSLTPKERVLSPAQGHEPPSPAPLVASTTPEPVPIPAVEHTVRGPTPPPRVLSKFEGLPEDVLFRILDCLDTHRASYWAPVDHRDRRNLQNLAAVSQRLRAVTLPLIFRTVTVKSDTQVNALYALCNGGELSYQFLGPPPDAAAHVKNLYSASCVPIADIWPGPKASPQLMQSISHLVAGPRYQYSMGLDLRFLLQMLPALRVFELYDNRSDDRILDRAARILRSHGHRIERFVYALGTDLQSFGGRYAFARAFGEMESLREIELLNLHIGEAPWIWAREVGLGRDWAPGDEEKLGMYPSCIWYRPELVIREPEVRLPSHLTSLRFRNIFFDPPKEATPPTKTIERLREHAPELLGITAKGKEKEVDAAALTTWPHALHPLSRLIQASAKSLTELGLEGVYDKKKALDASLVEYAIRDIAPRLTRLRLRRYGRVQASVRLLAMCQQIQHLVLDSNGDNDEEDQSANLLRSIPTSVRTLELWPEFRLSHVTRALEDGTLRIAELDLRSERWKQKYRISSRTVRELITRCHESGVRLRLWEAPQQDAIQEQEEEDEDNANVEDDNDEDGDGDEQMDEN